MKSSFTQMYVHVVFGTRNRVYLPDAGMRDELLNYMAGIIMNLKSSLYCGKVMPDHVHLLIRLHPSVSLSELVQKIKSNTAKHINDEKLLRGMFHWCEGYGAFSCSESVILAVRKYIENQAEHHLHEKFNAEYRKMLNMAGVKESNIDDYHMMDE